MTSDMSRGGPPVTDDGTQSNGEATDPAKGVGGTAVEEGKQVAGAAKEQAENVTAEAKQQARNLVDDARTQVDEQSRVQLDRLVTTLRTFGDDLEGMASTENGAQGIAQDLVRQVAEGARTLSSRIDARDPADLLEEVRSFGRRKPGTFLLGAMAAGVLAGRLTRGAKQASSTADDGQAAAASAPSGLNAEPRGTAAGEPLAGTGSPATEPVYPDGSDASLGLRTTGGPA